MHLLIKSLEINKLIIDLRVELEIRFVFDTPSRRADFLFLYPNIAYRILSFPIMVKLSRLPKIP